MKIVEIKKEEQIEVGLTYLEILQNSAPDSDTVEKCSRRFLMKGYPVAYEDVHHHPDKVLHGSRWIKSCYIWDDGGRSTTNYHSLSDMGSLINPITITSFTMLLRRTWMLRESLRLPSLRN